MARHAEQKILVGPPADEIRRICPGLGRVLGAGAVLRLGGAHHGGYGDSDIKYAYRQLSRALHPDKNPGVPEAPDAFKRLSEAAEELRQGLDEARAALKLIGGAVGSSLTPEMLERPQLPLLAETCKLFAAVLALTGEGLVPDAAQARARAAFEAAPAVAGGPGAQRLLARWYEADDLLALLASPPLRVAFDCAPKRLRAQFLCALSRAASAEATRNDSCVRGGWQKALGQFPEVALWRALSDTIRSRVLFGDNPDAAVGGGESDSAAAAADGTDAGGSDAGMREKQKAANVESVDAEGAGGGDGGSAGAGAGAGAGFSPWAATWREVIGAVLPPGLGAGALYAGVGPPPQPAALATDCELRRMSVALWQDVAAWASRRGAAPHLRALFAADEAEAADEDEEAASASGARRLRGRRRWAFVPATDLLLLVGDGLVGVTAEGFFRATSAASAGSGKQREHQKPFAEAFRQARRSGRKRGLSAAELDRPQAKQAKLNRGPTRVVLLTNMVGAGEVDEELQEETEEEAGKFGKLKSCAIREAKDAPDKEAVRIFLEYDKVEAAAKAYAGMNGRYFGGRTVKARFYDEARYERGELERRPPTRVLLLTNFVGPEDADEALETETLAEASRYGKVLRCLVREVSGGGACGGAPEEAVRVFIEFETSAEATKALSALGGRLCGGEGGREVRARFFDEDKFAAGELSS